jgi:hypothetical protein
MVCAASASTDGGTLDLRGPAKDALQTGGVRIPSARPRVVTITTTARVQACSLRRNRPLHRGRRLDVPQQAQRGSCYGIARPALAVKG